MVVIPYTAGKVHQVVVDRVLSEHPAALLCELPAADREMFDERSTAFAQLLRDLWREPGDLVVVEHDYLPPKGAIDRLLACPRQWCTHPAWIHDCYLPGTLNLARFSAGLKAEHPHLMDRITAPNPWWRQRACLKAGEPNPWPDDDPTSWPTSRHWRMVDSGIFRHFWRAGIRHHTHYPPGHHLHDYGPEQVERWEEHPPLSWGIAAHLELEGEA